jgi:hypothetical protein
VTRDLVFIDQRYLLVRDRVELATVGKLSWLLHAEKNLTWDAEKATAVIRGNQATLTARLVSPGVSWRGSVTDRFPVPVDEKYLTGEVGSSYVTGRWSNQSHLTAESTEAARSFTVFAVLWPERGTNRSVSISTTLDAGGKLVVVRPDGKTDDVNLTDDSFKLE